MYVSTDDPARRTEYRYLGPTGLTFPFPARPWALGLGALLTIVLGFIVFVATPFLDYLPFPGPLAMLAHVVVAGVGGGAVAGIIVRRIGKHIRPETPLKHKIAVLMSEIDTPRPDVTPQVVTTSFDRELFIEHRDRQVTTTEIPPFITVTDGPETN